MFRLAFAFLLAPVFLLKAAPSLAADSTQAVSQACRLVVDAASGKTLFRQGPCEVRQSPCSTFKIPLAVMGFDSGILKSETEPAWDYREEYASNRPEEKKRTDPTSWERLSVVWYSQKLAKTLGLPAFKKYVDQFGYGNRDLAGNPGQNDGLTQSWLMSSLLISPEEQVQFIQKLLQNKLGVSPAATRLTQTILPRFAAEGGWTVTGKTGSGFQKKTDGTVDRKLHQGWFVGWADKGERRLIFAEFLFDQSPHDEYAGPRAREQFLKWLPELDNLPPPAP